MDRRRQEATAAAWTKWALGSMSCKQGRESRPLVDHWLDNSGDIFECLGLLFCKTGATMGLIVRGRDDNNRKWSAWQGPGMVSCFLCEATSAVHTSEQGLVQSHLSFKNWRHRVQVLKFSLSLKKYTRCWKDDSVSKALATQAWAPEFCPSTHTNKQKSRAQWCVPAISAPRGWRQKDSLGLLASLVQWETRAQRTEWEAIEEDTHYINLWPPHTHKYMCTCMCMHTRAHTHTNILHTTYKCTHQL